MPPRRDCITCYAISHVTGMRCSRRSCKLFPYCWQHLRMALGLEVKKSQIPGAGLGLYSYDATFYNGQKIIEYTGDLKPNNPNDNTLFPYALRINEHLLLNADKPARHSVARYANDCRTINKKAGQCKGNNARLSVNPQARRGWIVATKTIHPGDEIFVSYGRLYWQPVKQPAKQPVKQPVKQPIKQQARKSAKQPVKQPVKKQQPTIYDYFRKH
jgi:SET domain-containing protein